LVSDNVGANDGDRASHAMIGDFHPTGWSEDQIRDKALAQGLNLPDACLPGIKANLALLEDRWATVEAALTAIGDVLP
jgi:hypothetical protein